jgi:hypothetical protein
MFRITLINHILPFSSLVSSSLLLQPASSLASFKGRDFLNPIQEVCRTETLDGISESSSVFTVEHREIKINQCSKKDLSLRFECIDGLRLQEHPDESFVIHVAIHLQIFFIRYNYAFNTVRSLIKLNVTVTSRLPAGTA